jgi:hypothetical protein
MKIVEKDNRVCAFEKLEQGDVFKTMSGEYCMKISPCSDGDDSVNFVLLEDGDAAGWIGKDVVVTKVNCELIIKD